jgi:3-deoxy-manno-octulosonate cytidylyltransferase (CMP-KDO synthetase)
MSNYLLIIPARMESSRFPGKLLKKINNYEVIKYVWLRCVKAVNKNDIFIATGDKEIIHFCQKEKINYIKTSKNCLTGSDRIIEIAKNIKKDFYINVQGDEIFVEPDSIKKVIKFCRKLKNKFIVNAYTDINSYQEYKNLNVPKVVFNKFGNLMYMSRSPLPSSKIREFQKSYKQVCIYAYPRDIILKIKKNVKTAIEKIEDIEILRFVESGHLVKMIKVKGSRLSIDTPNDLKKAKKIFLHKRN